MVPAIVKIGPFLNIDDDDLIVVFFIPATMSTVISLVLLLLRFSAKHKLDKYEKKISEYMDALWRLHFDSYQRTFASISGTVLSASVEDNYTE